MLSPSKTPTYRKAKKEIEQWVSDNSILVINNKLWYCGITKNPKIRKAQHMRAIGGKPYFFKAWCVKSLRIASSLETSFHNLGMGDKDFLGGAKDDSWYIYVYKKYPTALDVLFF